MKTLAWITLVPSICYAMFGCVWAAVAWETFTHLHWLTTLAAFAIGMGSLIIIVGKYR